MKRVLIISPYFPPSNAADMHRVRTSLPFFSGFDWNADVVCVNPKHSQILKDDFLLQSLPSNLKVYEVGAFDSKWTSKLGLGSLALRSMWYYLKRVNSILGNQPYDLIYFSTTQFPVCILGPYWKRKFNIPYVIDFQDPWHSDYYQNKPKNDRPAKYWFSYRLNKWLEPLAVKNVDGLISVSQFYIDDLKARYKMIKHVPEETITFGFFQPDISFALGNLDQFENLLDKDTFNIVYVGRGGADMHSALTHLFLALKKGLVDAPEVFKKFKFYFIGTSYAPTGEGISTVLPIAAKYGVQDSVIEITNRIGYYHTLSALQRADALFLPGSDDPKYTASKLYPYLLSKKPLLAILHQNSPAVDVLKNYTKNAIIIEFMNDGLSFTDLIFNSLHDWANGKIKATEVTKAFEQFNAKALTGRQVALFERAIKHFSKAM